MTAFKLRWPESLHVPIIIVMQIFFVVIFGVGVEYDDSANAAKDYGRPPEENSIHSYYPMFQDVHVMMFIGFGFLMTFLKRYGFSAVGLNMLIASLVLQWATLCQGFFRRKEDGKIHVNITNLLNADFASAAVLISFGAVLGCTTPAQLLVMAILEIMAFATNEWIGGEVMKAVDIGGSMFVHVFGAYFGLTVSLMQHEYAKSTPKEGSVYHSDLFAMIGTVFLWMFWPSFNAGLAPGDDQHRAVINTYYSLAACCITAFAISSLVSKDNKLDMVHIQNATLAGGVAIGTAADMMIHPYGAMLVGITAGALSVAGYRFLTPWLYERCGLHDTCGVNNLHGMPGILAGIVGAIMASLASEQNYGYSVYQQFPARAPPANTSHLDEIRSYILAVEPGDGRSSMGQAGYQLAALGITLLFAIVSGTITGLIIRMPFLGRQPKELLFDDSHFWETPEEDEESQVTPVYVPNKQDPQNDTKF